MKKIVLVFALIIGAAASAHAADLEVPAATGGDDTALIQSVLDLAQPGDRILFASGQTYNHSGTVTLRTSFVDVVGRGATLTATADLGAFIVDGASNVTVGGLQLAGTAATARSRSDRSCGLVSYHTQNLRVQGLEIAGQAGCGIMIGEQSGEFTLQGNFIHDTFADGIHVTNASHDGDVLSNFLFDNGDDGVGVVGYDKPGHVGPPFRINVIGNVVWKTPHPDVPGEPAYHGRGIAANGALDVAIANNYIEGTSSACIIVASSEPERFPTDRVGIQGNDLVSCNQDPTVTHGAILVTAAAGKTVSNVTIRQNRIAETVGASAHIRVSAFTSGVFLDRNAIYDADASHRPWIFYPGAGATASGNTYNGAPTP